VSTQSRQRPTMPLGARITTRIAITPTISEWCSQCVETTSLMTMKRLAPTMGPAKEREQRTGDAGQEARHHEGDEAHHIDVQSDQRGPHVVFPDRQKCLSKRTADHQMHQEKAERDRGQNEEVLEVGIGKAELHRSE